MKTITALIIGLLILAGCSGSSPSKTTRDCPTYLKTCERHPTPWRA